MFIFFQIGGGSCYVDQAGLMLLCFSLPSARITDIKHHGWLSFSPGLPGFCRLAGHGWHPLLEIDAGVLMISAK